MNLIQVTMIHSRTTTVESLSKLETDAMNSNGFIVGNVDTTVPEEPLVYFVNNPADTWAKRLK